MYFGNQVLKAAQRGSGGSGSKSKSRYIEKHF